MKGKIVLVPFPFTDLTTSKLRPAVIIYEGEQDVILAFISSKIPEKLSDAEVLITKEHKSFRNTGLKVDSIIRLDKIATIHKELILGEIGEIDSELRREVNEKLRKITEL